MFEDLRAAFREAIENFNKELGRDRVPGTVDALLRGMKNELVDAKALIADLEAQTEKAKASAAFEGQQALTCRRREELARRIGDTDTANVAAEYAEKHEARQRLLEQKAVALDQELQFRRRDTEEMVVKLREAQEKRDSLTATAGRSGARETLSAADELFRELDRMAEQIEGDAAEEEGERALDEMDLTQDRRSDLHVDLDERPEEVDVDAALEELKRRMRRE